MRFGQNCLHFKISLQRFHGHLKKSRLVFYYQHFTNFIILLRMTNNKSLNFSARLRFVLVHWIRCFAITQHIIKPSPLKFSERSLALQLVILVSFSTGILPVNRKIQQKCNKCQLTVCDNHFASNKFARIVRIVYTFLKQT